MGREGKKNRWELREQERIGVNSQKKGREGVSEGEREGGGGRVHVGACETGDSGAQSVREREGDTEALHWCVWV